MDLPEILKIVQAAVPRLEAYRVELLDRMVVLESLISCTAPGQVKRLNFLNEFLSHYRGVVATVENILANKESFQASCVQLLSVGYPNLPEVSAPEEVREDLEKFYVRMGKTITQIHSDTSPGAAIGGVIIDSRA